MNQAQYNNAPPAVGIFPQYAVPNPVTLVIQEYTHKSKVSGSRFAVRDSQGAVVCNVSGKARSYSEQKDFTDAAGQPLFTLKKKAFSTLGSHEIVGPDGSLLVDIDGKYKFAKIKMSIKFENRADGVPLEVSIQGNSEDRNAQMRLVQTGAVLATFSGEQGRRWKLFKQKHEVRDYFVHVVPGVDLALIAALAVAFDERQAESRQTGFGVLTDALVQASIG